MRSLSLLAAAAVFFGCLTGCGTADKGSGSGSAGSVVLPDFSSQAEPALIYDLNTLTAASAQPAPDLSDAVQVTIAEADGTVTVTAVAADGTPVQDAVYTAHDIVYYEAGHDFTYGEGTDADAHTREEADAHTVVHITRPGVYRLSGRLSAGQIAVDLGDEAENDPDAVVTLVLDGLDITCTVAPAVIFYRVYECGSADTDTAAKDVDTTGAGARVVIADGSENVVNGSYVARIYKPGTVVLNEDGTEVEDAKKLHKYDAAFYSRMSMNLYGGAENTGVLTINAENEGLDSELHLTIHGGRIHIASGNDGINTNEDGVSVTTIHGGLVDITVTGSTGEGDGIDSNGWLVINGGMVTASACGFSGDAGIDSDMGIWLNGGVVAASGNMLDRIAGGTATYAVFQFAGSRSGGQTYRLAAADGSTAAAAVPANDFSILILSAPQLAAGDYTLWNGQTRLAHSGTQTGGMGGQRPGMELPDDFDPAQGGMAWPEGTPPARGDERPDGMMRPEDQPPADSMGQAMQPPDGFDAAQGGQRPGRGEDDSRIEADWQNTAALSDIFTLNAGQNQFSAVTNAS